MSVSSGGAGPASARGGHVDFSASAATAFGGSVSGAAVVTSASGSGAGSPATESVQTSSAAPAFGSAAGCESSAARSIGAPGDEGTVVAHALAPLPRFAADGSGSVQSGSVFSLAVAGSAVTLEVAAPGFAVWAHTGVVSLVGTAAAGSSDNSRPPASAGGVGPSAAAGSISKSRSV